LLRTGRQKRGRPEGADATEGPLSEAKDLVRPFGLSASGRQKRGRPEGADATEGPLSEAKDLVRPFGLSASGRPFADAQGDRKGRPLR